MSIVRAYARGRLNGLGYEEWADGFNFENIPRTMQNRAYHLILDDASPARLSMDNLTVTEPLRIRILLAGFRDPKTRIDQAIALASPIIDEFLAPINRLTQGVSINEKILNVFFRTKSAEPYGASNDNLMWLNLGFDFQVIRSMRGSA